MKDYNEFVCFARTAELRSLSKAAAALALPKSTVSRKIAALEKRLGLTLLSRTTRAVNLTESGRSYFEHAMRALQSLSQAEEEAQRGRDTLVGLLRVTAPVEFSVGPFMDLIAQFANQYPDIRLDLLFTERVVDLISESVDLAIRIGELESSSLLHRKLGTLDSVLVASPGYLKKFGIPEDADELSSHRLIGFSPSGVLLPWQLRSPTSRRTLRPHSTLVSNHILALKSAVLAHQGIALMPSFIIESELQQGRLRVLLSEWKASGAPVHLVMPSQRFVAPRVRVFADRLVKGLKLFREAYIAPAPGGRSQ